MKKTICVVLSVAFIGGVCRLAAHDPAEGRQVQTPQNKNRKQNKNKQATSKRAKKAGRRQLGPGATGLESGGTG